MYLLTSLNPASEMSDDAGRDEVHDTKDNKPHPGARACHAATSGVFPAAYQLRSVDSVGGSTTSTLTYLHVGS